MKKLFALFIDKSDLESKLEEVRKVTERIYALELKDSEELLLTFNTDSHFHQLPARCFPINKKKETNTIYTINGLNCLIQSLIGRIDNSYMLDWTQYRSKVILTDGDKPRIVNTRVYKIY